MTTNLTSPAERIEFDHVHVLVHRDAVIATGSCPLCDRTEENPLIVCADLDHGCEGHLGVEFFYVPGRSYPELCLDCADDVSRGVR